VSEFRKAFEEEADGADLDEQPAKDADELEQVKDAADNTTDQRKQKKGPVAE
jgi:hypothetical protein